MVAKLDNGKYSLRFEKNYGGVVDALVDAQVRSGNRNIETYTENFAGIIAAIQDLNVSGDALTGEKPPGWTPGTPGTDNEDEGVQDPAVPTGTLWFDERQGRLYVYAGAGATAGWYQTNGADGYVYVSPSAPSNPVTGQLWMDTDNSNQLFVMVNDISIDPSLSAVYGQDTATMSPVWVPVGGSTTITSTANLPLATPTRIVGTPRSNINWPETTGLTVQKDYNEWILNALQAVDTAVEELEETAGNAQLAVSDTPPADPEEGNLWFDTERIDLNVFYDGYWVSTGAPNMVTFSAASELDDKIAVNTQSIYEKGIQISELFQQIASAKNNHELLNLSLNSEINNIKTNIDGFIKLTDVTSITDSLNARLTAEESRQTDLSAYPTIAEMNAAIYDMMYSMSDHATESYVNTSIDNAKMEVTALIPDISTKADTTYVDQQIDALDFLPASGGTIDGFTFNRGNISNPGLDFSSSSANGLNALAFKPAGSTTANSFGVGNQPFEMAWKFDSNEDYCWIHSNNKVASINKRGIACIDLHLAEFSDNTINGVELVNTIDVRERLAAYQLALQNLRSSVSGATDLDSLKTAIINALAGV